MEYATHGTLQQYLAEIYQRRQDPHNTNVSHTYMNVRLNPMAKRMSYTLTKEQMVNFGCQIAAGLAYVHGKNVKLIHYFS